MALVIRVMVARAHQQSPRKRPEPRFQPGHLSVDGIPAKLIQKIAGERDRGIVARLLVEPGKPCLAAMEIGYVQDSHVEKARLAKSSPAP